MHSMQQTNEIFILTNLKDFHTGKKSNLLKRQLISVLCIYYFYCKSHFLSYHKRRVPGENRKETEQYPTIEMQKIMQKSLSYSFQENGKGTKKYPRNECL